ncbi:M48 family metallopeptidase [Methyloversatilis thermotolerans]|uniref:M48 family metallopeptidase n=1 Tax=Methyloversatilis thermotolerans TaxID=1346290 RepID=UPI00037CE0BA|nr:M48 family metallopeptidase [Methyloversatilis thermotolerans]
MSTSRSEAIPALYFDGRSARPHAAQLWLEGDVLRLEAADLSRSDPVMSLRVSEPMGRAPRLVSFPDGAHAEIRAHEQFARLLQQSGHVDRATVRFAFDARWVLASVGLLLLLVWAGGRWGLPWAAERVAPLVPRLAVEAMSTQALALIDERLLEPSTLDADVTARLAETLAARTDVPHRLYFRSGGPVGANAFALPDGALIVTDELVALAPDDEAVIAVLMHELGHVELRHGLRMMLQGSAVALIMTGYFGDVSNLLATAPTYIIQSGYSRDMEREADDYARRKLLAQGRSPAVLADMLERLASAHRDGGDGPSGWLSSHPDVAERVAALRERSAPR